MKPQNFRTLVVTSWLGFYFGVNGCLLGLRALGMPIWGVFVGIGVASVLSMFFGAKHVSELYEDHNDSSDQ